MTMQRDDDGYGIFESDPRLTAGNLQIIACAGSGKTEFVSARIAYMVSRGIARPGNVYKECRVPARARIIGPFRKMPDEPFGRRPKDKKICGDCDWKRLCPGST
jgi:hypothetical protein